MQTVLDRLGIENSIEIIDYRTMQILKYYHIYKNAPYKLDNSTWYEAVEILNQLEQRLF